MGTKLSTERGKKLEVTGLHGEVDFGEGNITCLISSKNASLNDEDIGANLSVTENRFC